MFILYVNRFGGFPNSFIVLHSHYFQLGIALSPSRRREAPCEGTNSPRLFTPGETKALGKSKVHQISRAWVTVTELYYITGGPARDQQVKPKTWRILRHCHDYWSLNSWQLPLSQPRS